LTKFLQHNLPLVLPEAREIAIARCVRIRCDGLH
jgi:hypothetical protein